ncbi:MAG: integral rane sensor signal transduction histidine kinase [Blastococcus sp.]|nr:integral rane sensor signal transduction histidine kinase [Blastococcus sp.]
MSLRVRLALLFAACAAVAIAVAGVAFVVQLRASVDASLDPGLRSRVRAIADELATGDAVRAGPGDQILQVIAGDGRVVAASPGVADLTLLDRAQQRQAAAGEVSFVATVAGDRSRLLATTITSSGQRLLIIVGTGTDVSDAAVARARSALLLGGPPAVALVGVGAWLLAGAALRPVERMRREAAEISDRDTGRRLPIPGTQDEIAALAVTFNALLGRLQGALERERAFVADAGHELRTPLTILRGELELAARPGRTAESLRSAVGRAAEDTDRLIRIAEDLLLLARADSGQPFLDRKEFRLESLLTAAARGARALAAPHSVTVAVDCPPDLTVRADPDRVRQVVDNLLENATRHSTPGGQVTVAATVTPRGPVLLEVRDQGTGFPGAFLPLAFERFQRADAGRPRDSGGTGLGLAIVAAIVRAHGGRVTAVNVPPGGAVVSVELPPGRAPEPSTSGAGQGTVSQFPEHAGRRAPGQSDRVPGSQAQGRERGEGRAEDVPPRDGEG